MLEDAMADNASHKQKGQDERAQRIHQQIERLKSGISTEDSSESQKSLKEQVDERSKQAAVPPSQTKK